MYLRDAAGAISLTFGILWLLQRSFHPSRGRFGRHLTCSGVSELVRCTGATDAAYHRAASWGGTAGGQL